MDDASLSEHEQRILAEIERNLVAEDSEFVRRVREAGPRKVTVRLLRASVLGLVAGLALLVAFQVNVWLGALGFLLMLASAVGIGTSVRALVSGGGPPSALFKDAWRRAEAKIRERRSKS